MLEPEKLNPDDVLYHLNALGFKCVTSQQLKDFIHDLKKLIKYEQEKGRHYCEEKSQCDQVSNINCDCVESEVGSHKCIISDELYSCSLTSDTLTKSSKSDDENSEYSKSSETIRNRNLAKTPSSFIRPRNLPVNNQNSFKTRKKLDPVKLYHHYQDLWRHNKIPGQNNHSHLRWVIRNRMLGQEHQA